MNPLRVAAAFTASLFALTSVAPAQAANPLSNGLVRIDSSWATVKTLADDSLVVTFANSATGEWMGEVGPTNQLMVRDVDDEHLVRAWNDLGHSADTAIPATLTWNAGANFALVAVSDPRITPRGHLRFRINPGVDLPPRLEDVDINISRAATPQPRTFPTNETYALTSTAEIFTINKFAYTAEATINDSGINCYEATALQSAPIVQLPANLACETLTFTSGTFTMNLPLPTQNGTLLFSSSMLASGASFSFSAVVASWPESGS
jgi:hypothetical protein